jgi:hypothetical protein
VVVVCVGVAGWSSSSAASRRSDAAADMASIASWRGEDYNCVCDGGVGKRQMEWSGEGKRRRGRSLAKRQRKRGGLVGDVTLATTNKKERRRRRAGHVRAEAGFRRGWGGTARVQVSAVVACAIGQTARAHHVARRLG